MSRRCPITGKGPLVGNHVSHANNKTLRRFLPNLQAVSLWSDTLKRPVSMRISNHGLRTVEFKGGIDAWLLAAKSNKLTKELRDLKKLVLKANPKVS